MMHIFDATVEVSRSKADARYLANFYNKGRKNGDAYAYIRRNPFYRFYPRWDVIMRQKGCQPNPNGTFWNGEVPEKAPYGRDPLTIPLVVRLDRFKNRHIETTLPRD